MTVNFKVPQHQNMICFPNTNMEIKILTYKPVHSLFHSISIVKQRYVL